MSNKVNLDNTTAIILAGGMGTRLRSVVADLPKPMAPVAGKPFLHYQFLYLQKQGIKNVVLSVGYMAEYIQEYFGENYADIAITYSVESQPLGTGGAIKKAMELVQQNCFVLNGDTFFDAELNTLLKTHTKQNADATLALSYQTNFDRYGTVAFDSDMRINAFKEKQFMHEGWINGGIYLLNSNVFARVEETTGNALPEKFSFEKEILESQTVSLQIYASLHKNYFIDIGIPEDYARANQEFPEMFTS